MTIRAVGPTTLQVDGQAVGQFLEFRFETRPVSDLALMAFLRFGARAMEFRGVISPGPIERFGSVCIGLATATYRDHHRRLPGSTRTARLRKKRRTRVMDWYGRFLEGRA